MENGQLAEIFDRMADILEFKGENVFKVNAYRKASRTIAEFPEDVRKVWQENRLAEIPGIGKGLQEKIQEFMTTQKITEFEELLQSAPQGIFDLLLIQNLGPKTLAMAFRELGVATIADLDTVINDGRLAKLPGMGAKKVENIRKGLELRKVAEERLSIGIALVVAESVIDYLRQTAGDKVGRIMPAGSVRRFRETVHDIDILAETDHGREIVALLTQMQQVTQILGAGDTKGSVILQDRFQVDVRAVPAASFGAALQYFTGSQAHNVRLRDLAKKQGLKINEYGIFSDEEKIGGASEEDIYRHLHLPWIAPELREDRGEIEAALENRLPDLIELHDIRADLHAHSQYSDGQLTLQQMAEAMRARGYSYMCFCDHSKSAFYANGMSIERLLRQIREIDALNKKFDDFTILTGTETDILPDGTLDFPDEILAQLDFVVASIHSAFKTDPTGRTLAAMENPYVDVIGHPTGRLISRREGFEIDIDRVITKARETGTALEINSFWDRLDLSDLNTRKAIENDVKLAINTDAHDQTHLEMIRFGVATARRGWATKEHIINAMPLEEMRAWQKRRRLT